MAETDQAKPLAFQSLSDEEASRPYISDEFNLFQKRSVKFCGCCTAFLLIVAVTILVLFFTAFHVHKPKININEITVLELEFGNGSITNGTNITLLVDVSIKNPNYVSFKFKNGTTIIVYGDNKVGEGIIPSGVAKARRTIHMNVTVHLIPEILKVPSLIEDFRSGKLSMNSSTVIGGNVKIAKIVKKFYTVEVNCSMTYDLSSQAIEKQHCKSHFL